MEQANKALWSALKRVARPEKPLDLLTAVWPVVLGPRLASHTRPVAWSKGCVTIDAPEPEWRSQLQQMAGEIRKQINKWWGSELITEVRIAGGRRGGTAKGPSSSSSSRARAAALEAAESSAGAAQEDPRPDAETKLQSALKELEPSLRGIADEELRDLITRVATKYLAGREKK